MDKIHVYGRDLVEEVMGQWSFAELCYAAMTGGQRPSAEKTRMVEVLLTTFVDHGVTPSSLATRLTFLGAPEAMQAAIAAGLCGAGSRYLGTMQTAAEMLQLTLSQQPEQMDVESCAQKLVMDYRKDKRIIPGLGHPEHKGGDPRTPKLVELAKKHDCYGRHCALLMAIGDAASSAAGRYLPINAAGLAGAIVLDMGLPPEAGRGLAIVSRAAGLVGVVLSEMRQPSAQAIWDQLR